MLSKIDVLKILQTSNIILIKSFKNSFKEVILQAKRF